MLAYLFWHRPKPAARSSAYERALGDFHRALAVTPPPGYAGSAVFRTKVPWIGQGGAAYEDWYLVESFEALGALNDAAIAVHRATHDAVAVEAAEGAGGLYGLRAGSAVLAEARWLSWLTKPEGVGYDDFYASLEPQLRRGSLWTRQLVLGPGREFCLVGEAPPELPPEIPGLTVESRPLVVTLIP